MGISILVTNQQREVVLSLPLLGLVFDKLLFINVNCLEQSYTSCMKFSCLLATLCYILESQSFKVIFHSLSLFLLLRSIQFSYKVTDGCILLMKQCSITNVEVFARRFPEPISSGASVCGLAAYMLAQVPRDSLLLVTRISCALEESMQLKLYFSKKLSNFCPFV